MITKDNSELFRELNQSILEVLMHIAIQCKFINSPSFSSGRGHGHQHISLPQSPEGSFIPPLSPYPPPFPLSLLPSPPYPQANFNLSICCCPSNPTCCGHSHPPLPRLSHSGSSTPVRKGERVEFIIPFIFTSFLSVIGKIFHISVWHKKNHKKKNLDPQKHVPLAPSARTHFHLD